MSTDQATKKRTRRKEAGRTDLGFYDWLAPNYDRLQPVLDPCRFQTQSIMLDILNAISPSPEYVLDFGCRTGCMTLQILELCPDTHVYAIDPSLEMLHTARENLDDFSGQITLAKADFRDPWEGIIKDPIDVAMHYAALNHLPHDALREVYTRLLGVLRPGGWFIHGEITEERLPEPVQRIATNIRSLQRDSAIADLPDGESLIGELEEHRQAEQARGQLTDNPAMAEQQIAWLVNAGFEFATRVYQDWRTSIFLARKPE